MINKRPEFFGKLMPKEPKDAILVQRYHKVNAAFDKYPDKRDTVVDVTDDTVICSNGEKLAI